MFTRTMDIKLNLNNSNIRPIHFMSVSGIIGDIAEKMKPELSKEEYDLLKEFKKICVNVASEPQYQI